MFDNFKKYILFFTRCFKNALMVSRWPHTLIIQIDIFLLQHLILLLFAVRNKINQYYHFYDFENFLISTNINSNT